MTKYLTDNEGKFIPATQRPDGTWRKARRVKDGYVPQEEVPLYESKGKLFGKKPDLPVGMCPLVGKAVKDKQKKCRTNQIEGLIVLPATNSAHSSTNSSTQKSASEKLKIGKCENNDVRELTKYLNDFEIDDQQELTRKIKKLKKKIRDIEAIEDKLKSGELKKPEKDQLDKVRRKKQYLKGLEELEEQQI